MDKKKFAKDFKRAREGMGLTQKELAKLIGKSPASVQNYEDEESIIFPQAKIWGKIREVMGIDVQAYKYPDKVDNRRAGDIRANNGSMVNVNSDNATMSHKSAYMALTPEERELIENLRLAKIIKANE